MLKILVIDDEKPTLSMFNLFLKAYGYDVLTAEDGEKGLALFHDKRLCVFYTYESNLADGWADPDIHNDPELKRDAALKMGVNIIVWALTR